MNSEKQITITDLKGKFTKDFDTFGKMDPFLEFRVGKFYARTETHDGGGKQPVWQNQIVLTYYDEPNILLNVFDVDATENEFIGSTKIQIKSLRFPGGVLQVNILTDSGQIIGSVTAKYTIKNMPAVPLLIIKNIKCDFVKEHSFIIKSKPFVQFRSDEGSVSSDPKDESKDLVLSWNETLRLKIKDGSKFKIYLLDKNDKDSYIFIYECSVKDFKFQNGFKKFNVFDQQLFMLGTIQFDYETVNLVSKEESVKNAEKQKKNECQLTSIFIEKANLDLALEGKDIYMRLIIGANSITTDVIKNIPKILSVDIKKNIYAEVKQSKIMILIWEKNILKDKIIGVATIPLEGLSSGEKKVIFMDKQQKGDVGTGSFLITTKQTSLKVLTIDTIAVSFVEGGDLLGQSQPYIVARIGGWEGRTETGDQNRISFKKGIEIKFNDEQTLQLQVWDEDAVNDEIIYSQKVSLSEFKVQKGQMSLPLTLKENDKLVKKGKISFKYELKINTLQNQNIRKLSQKKLIEPKNQQPKVSQIVLKNNKSQVRLPLEKSNSAIKPQKNETIISGRKKQTIQVQPSKKNIKETLVNNQIQLTNKSLTPNKNNSDLPTNLHNDRQPQRLATYQGSHHKSKSKQSVNLPSIISSRVNFGDRIFEKQSSATLQTSILVYSMPKGPRFVNEPKYSGEPTYCMDTCFKSNSTKGVGFGFGRKKQFPDWMQRNMKQNPAPGAYLQSSGSDIRSRGPTFGISHKHYEKVLIARQKRQTSQKLQPIRQRKK